MGEVVVSCEEAMDVVVVEKERENEEKRGNNEGSSSMVRWDRSLPRTAIRVLLVEADDSTRQIIGALLRKCNYKVASVADGLKAWEVLKARHHDIDLILTEVELPSISGYALLTLISEHEICKNIPVIMMSAHDSVSMVYKCMLKGAADFLVKPIRINELKNLWQHVWRRQSMNRGHGPQDESITLQKLEATAENTATSEHSSSSKTCAPPPRPEESTKKRSDAQSSCQKLDLEAESTCKAGAADGLQPKQGKSPVSDPKMQDQSNCTNSSQNLCTSDSAVGGSVTTTSSDDDALDQDGRVEQQSREENMNLHPEASDSRNNLPNSPREAIDLIGAFDRHSRHNSCANGVARNCDSFAQLDLSLRRFHPGASIHEKQRLNHSNASPFTQYVNKALHNPNSNANFGSTSKEDKLDPSDHLSGDIPGSSSENKKISLPNDSNRMSLPLNLTKEAENHATLRLFPIPFPERGVKVDLCSTPAGYGPTASPRDCSPSSSHSPCSGNQQMNSFHQFSVEVINGRSYYHPLDQSPRISSNQSTSKQDHQQLESSEDRTHFSLPADQSASSNICNGTAARHLNGFMYGAAGRSSTNVQQDAVVPGGSDSGNELLSCQRSIQREAALTKFRLKRKERCFDKKVRYESRKKLAEQRPRVKGQFVRQVLPDLSPKSDNSAGNSVAN